MSTFDEREHAFESKYAHDAEMRFRAEARRNRLLGEWAADKLGKTGDEKAAYTKDVMKSDFKEAGDEDVYRKVKDDLGDSVTEDELRAKMREFKDQAMHDVGGDLS